MDEEPEIRKGDLIIGGIIMLVVVLLLAGLMVAGFSARPGG